MCNTFSDKDLFLLFIYCFHFIYFVHGCGGRLWCHEQWVEVGRHFVGADCLLLYGVR